jgi:hypothetical protein
VKNPDELDAISHGSGMVHDEMKSHESTRPFGQFNDM